MLNQYVIVGRITEEPSYSNAKTCDIVLAIPRNYKNKEGEYETDFITITLTNHVAERTMEYCHKGDLIGVKGCVQSVKTLEGYKMILTAEKVTFLSTKKESEGGDE